MFLILCLFSFDGKRAVEGASPYENPAVPPVGDGALDVPEQGTQLFISATQCRIGIFEKGAALRAAPFAVKDNMEFFLREGEKPSQTPKFSLPPYVRFANLPSLTSLAFAYVGMDKS